MENFNKGYAFTFIFFIASFIMLMFGVSQAAVWCLIIGHIWWAAGWVYDKIS